MLPCAFNSRTNNFVEQCLHMIYHESRINVLKGFNKIEKFEYKIIYYLHPYNFQRNKDVKQRGLKL